MRITASERGDTIIEVLFAITVFSLVSIGGLSLMNKGTALAQRALEIDLVREQIDTQADSLRYLNRMYINEYGKGGQATDIWNKIIDSYTVSQAQPFEDIADNDTCHLGDRPFAIDVTKIDSSKPFLTPVADAATYAKVRYDTPTPRAEGIWIQAVRSPAGADSDSPGFFDFHIRACWQTPGQSSPVTIGTIVRLYEPRG